jgi:hypothetical protein
MKKEISWIGETAHLSIEATPIEGITELNRIGATIHSVTGTRVTGMMNCTLEKANELIDDGWQWV